MLGRMTPFGAFSVLVAPFRLVKHTVFYIGAFYGLRFSYGYVMFNDCCSLKVIRLFIMEDMCLFYQDLFNMVSLFS